MLDEAFKLLDPYTLRARLLPALLAGLPIAVSFVAWFPDRLTSLGILLGSVALLGGTTLLSQATRDCGKKLEPELFNAWGGIPSVTLLRHRDDHLNPETKQRYHRQLENLIAGLKLPNRDSEAADPATADRIYKSCSDFLRERTRQTENFGLLLSENINYGTRRNLLGLRACAILLSALGMILCAGAALHAWLTLIDPVISLVSFVIATLCLLWWSFRVNRDWVKTTAFAYAERLLAACDQLEVKA